MTRIAILPGGLQSEPTCDLLVTCLGYESRCVFFAQRAVNGSRSRIALQFQQRLAGSYDANKQFYQESGFALIPFIEQGFGSAFRHVAGAALLGHAERPHVIVDVSSMSRPMIATAVLQVRELARQRPMDVTFVYCPAKFTKPSQTHNPISLSEPVTPEFAGWSLEPERPVAAMVGLGFEFDQGLGAVEFLEPAATWAFVPYGEDERYDDAMAEANTDLIETLPLERIVRYDVGAPDRCFAELEALTYGVLTDFRPIIVPFGPKIFALLAVLIGLIHAPEVTVWRVSGDQAGAPDDRVASGRIISLRTQFGDL